MDWLELAGFIVAILGLIFGTTFAVKWRHLVNLLKELGEAFTTTSEALEDKKITKQEAINCLKEWQDVFAAIIALKGNKAL